MCFSIGLLAQTPEVGDVVANPYASPFLNCNHNDPALPEQEPERMRADLNNDGVADLVLKLPSECGNGGCFWEIFIKKGKVYIYIGEVFGNVVGVMPCKKRGIGRIRTYSHGSANSGYYAAYEVSDQGVRKLSGRTITTEKDAQLFEKLFKDQHKVWLSIQIGQCLDGVSTWPSP